MRLSWALVCGIIISRGILGNRVHMLSLGMYADTSVYDVCKVNRRLQYSNLRCTLGTRLVRGSGWQGGRQDVLLLFSLVSW